MANFNFYDSESTDGFLGYRDEIITFYDTDSKCNQGIVDTSLFKKKKLKLQEILNDYNDDSTLIYPHEPTHVSFEIREDGELIKIKVF